MTIYAFPSITPSRTSWELVSNTAIFPSPITGAIQTIDRGGEHWRVRLTFPPLTAADKAVMRAFLVKLNGQQHRFTLQDHSQVQRGSFGGTPLVAGTDQTGTSLMIDGCSSNITNWIRAGDLFAVNADLKMAIEDANSDGTGLATIVFSPRIVTPAADNAALTTIDPTGVFMLASNVSGWLNSPGDFGAFTIDCTEDVLA